MIWVRVLKKSKESITQPPDPKPLTPAKKALPQTSGIMLGDVSSHTHHRKTLSRGIPTPPHYGVIAKYIILLLSLFLSYSSTVTFST